MTKLYVKKFSRTTVDGEKLVSYETYESKPETFSFIVWTKK